MGCGPPSPVSMTSLVHNAEPHTASRGSFRPRNEFSMLAHSNHWWCQLDLVPDCQHGSFGARRTFVVVQAHCGWHGALCAAMCSRRSYKAPKEVNAKLVPATL